MSDPQTDIGRLTKKLKQMLADDERSRRENIRIIRVDKQTHRVRFEDETEEEVVIIVEGRGE